MSSMLPSITTFYFGLGQPLPLLPSLCRHFWTISELKLTGEARSQLLGSPARMPKLTVAGHSGGNNHVSVTTFFTDGYFDPKTMQPEP